MLERQKTTAARDDFVQDYNTKQEKINKYDRVYSLTLRFSTNLDFIDDRCPFFYIICLYSQSFRFRHTQIILYIFQIF
jgi:hypothetical protein